MKIAICDDDFIMIKKLRDDISFFFKDLKENIELLTFSNGKSLIEAIQKDEKYFDIILLDIDMPDITGLKVAEVLRKISDDIIIIFISSYDGFVFDSLEYNPFRYIRKNRMKEELYHALKAAYMLYKKRVKKHFFIKSDDGEYIIEQTEILYFEIIRRKLFIYLKDDRILSTWKPLKDFFREVDDGSFVKIHSGCAVNMKYIREYSNCDITLDNGKKLSTSRSGIKILKDELTRYWSECV